MKKRILSLFLLISILALPFSSCQRYSTPSATDISSEERAKLGIDENAKAFTAWRIPLLNRAIRQYGPPDKIKNNLIKKEIDIINYYRIIVLDPNSELYEEGWEKIQTAIFNPSEFLSAKLGESNVKVNQILCYGGNISLRFPADYGIYYDTNKGKFVYLIYDEDGKHYFIPWNIFWEKLDEASNYVLDYIGSTAANGAEKFYSEYEITP